MTFAIVLLSILCVVAVIWAIYTTIKLKNAPAERDAALQRAAVLEQALKVEKAGRSDERTAYEAQLERARARRTECENAWVKEAPPAAVLGHLRGLDDELQPLHKDGDPRGAGVGGEAGKVPPRT